MVITASNAFNEALVSMISKGRGNQWLQFGPMRCYIRVGNRFFQGKNLLPCIQLANLNIPQVRHQRKGIFTELVIHLQYFYPDFYLFLENVLEPKWAETLIAKYDWELVSLEGETPCLLKRPKYHNESCQRQLYPNLESPGGSSETPT